MAALTAERDDLDAFIRRPKAFGAETDVGGPSRAPQKGTMSVYAPEAVGRGRLAPFALSGSDLRFRSPDDVVRHPQGSIVRRIGEPVPIDGLGYHGEYEGAAEGAPGAQPETGAIMFNWWDLITPSQ